MALVQVTVDQIDLHSPANSGVQQVSYYDEQATVHEALRAWAKVRGYDSFVRAVDQCLGTEPPESGLTVVLNKPNSLLLQAVWPWGPDEMKLAHL